MGGADETGGHPAQFVARRPLPSPPLCTIACVHQASAPDRFRRNQTEGRYPGGPLIALRTRDNAPETPRSS